MRSNGVVPLIRALGQKPAMNAAAKIVRGCSTLMVLALLTGCAEPRLDASSQERALASTAKLRGQLAGAELAEFDSLMSEALASSRRSGETKSLADALVVYNGMTGREVVEKHRRLRHAEVASQEARDKDIRSRMQDIRAEATEVFEKVRITEVSTEKTPDPDRALIHASINNGLPYTITSVKVRMELRSPDRELEWASIETTFPVPGGIESGELVRARTSEKWEIFSALSLMDEHPEARLHFFAEEVVRTDGTTVPNPYVFSSDERARLAEMQSETGPDQTESISSTPKE